MHLIDAQTERLWNALPSAHTPPGAHPGRPAVCVCAVAYVENLCGQLVAVAVACLALPRQGHLRGVASSQRGIVVAAAVAPAVAA